jgi:N-acetylglucosaminyldiphosphoundecaprenol N-acetyl-beta-D-mannosaminyltransferase
MDKLGRIDLFEFPFDRLSLDQMVEKVEEVISTRKPHRLVVVNAAKVVKAQKDIRLKQVIQTADFVGPDGVPLVWLSRFLGKALPSRVNGTDLMERLFDLSARKGFRLFLFGATEAVIRKTVETVKQNYPGAQIAGFRNGYFTEADEPEIVAQIKATRADILLVGFGTPKKEFWIAKYKDQLQVPFIHGVGGSFDVVAGITQRAPVWMQKSGLEWLFRVYQEPGRMWRRYLVTNSIFIWLSLQEILKYMFHNAFARLNPKKI